MCCPPGRSKTGDTNMTLKIIQLVGIFLTSYWGVINLAGLIHKQRMPAGNLFMMSAGVVMIFARVVL
jgi:hypothetical protein